MHRSLTAKQARIRDYMADSFDQRGLYPTLREIAGHFGIALGTVQDHIAALEAKEVLKREKGRFRGLTLIMRPGSSSERRLPLLGRIPAGNPIEALEGHEDMVSIDSTLAGDADYLLRVKGDSMEPEIYSGDIVLVRQAQVAEDGEIIVAQVGGDEVTLKRLRRKGGSIWLQPSNLEYSAIKSDFRVMGRVLGLVRRFGGLFQKGRQIAGE